MTHPAELAREARSAGATLDDLPPEVAEHFAKTASPAHVAMTVTADLPDGHEAKWTPARHLLYMNERVRESCLADYQTFLDLEVSVRHGKSVLVSGYTPFWYLGWFPDRRVILLSYNEDKAAEWGEFTRELMAQWGPELFDLTVDPKSASKTLWSVKGHRGEVLAAGLGGTITGKGGDLIVIDDPVKNRDEANSKAVRERLHDGYYSNGRTRLQPAGTIILAMARWRDDDLAGTVVHGHGEEEGELDEIDFSLQDDWEVIRFPAIAEAPKPPEDCDDPVAFARDWRDEIGRAEGEPLWPEIWPLEILARIRATLLRKEPQTWYSLYQQAPTAKGGNMFLVDAWVYANPGDPITMRQGLRLVRWWDLAASKDSGDWSVGTLMGMTSDGTLVVLDVVRVRKAPGDLEKLVRKTARRDGTTVPIRIEQEKAGAGKTVTANYKRLLVGFDVDGIPPVGDKELRATPAAGAQQDGRIVLVRAEWNKAWVEEHRLFPKGRNDDMVDTLSGGFDFLAGAGPTTMELDYQLSTPTAALYAQRESKASAAAAVASRRAALARR